MARARARDRLPGFRQRYSVGEIVRLFIVRLQKAGEVDYGVQHAIS